MKKHRLVRYYIALGVVLAMTISSVRAQIVSEMCESDYRIGPESKGKLSLEIDNISFFKDNEFSGSVVKGYTLPGLWLQPKLVFYPLENIKLEVGASMMWFNGAYKYPVMSYCGIAKWNENDYQRGLHALPYFRAQIAMGKSWNFVLGNIYGKANHHLIEPLYNPELNLTGDPEAGIQALYNSRHFDADIWVNWESFIFRGDDHQEAFTLGASTRIRYNMPDSKVHFFSPVQVVWQHRGGEINNVEENSVKTFLNAAAGLGVTWNINRKILKRVNAEVDAVGYLQQTGDLLPFDQGAGIYANASVDLGGFRVKGGYFICHNFISMMGSPFFGTVSTTEEGATYKNPQTLYASLEYVHYWTKHYALGFKADLYNRLPGTIQTSGASIHEGNALSFSAGLFFRINPSFLLKKFK